MISLPDCNFVIATLSRKKGVTMRKISILFSMIGLSMLFAILFLPVTLHAIESVVTGQNNPEHDIKAIQDAVDKGGTVLLKGMFNFGEKGQVKINNDIEVSGEDYENGVLPAGLHELP